MRKPTIYEIKGGYEALGFYENKETHFFDRDTLRFFHERMADMRVDTVEPGLFSVRTRRNRHYFRAVNLEGQVLTGPVDTSFYFRHLGTTLPED